MGNNNQERLGQPGIPVDRYGGATVDPTKNVLDLVTAAVKRIDDLRDLETKRIDERVSREKEHTREIMALRAEHAKDLRDAEAKRIDAIREVDVQAGSARDERATNQASVLANQVTTTAAATAVQLDQITKLLSDRIAALEKSQYEGVGKEKISDPILQKLVEKIDSLGIARSEGTGQKQGVSSTIFYIVLALGTIGTILGIISFLK
jgi:hypothetical protein